MTAKLISILAKLEIQNVFQHWIKMEQKMKTPI